MSDHKTPAEMLHDADRALSTPSHTLFPTSDRGRLPALYLRAIATLLITAKESGSIEQAIAIEREACATIADEHARLYRNDHGEMRDIGNREAAKDIASGIRTRSNKP